MPQIKLVSGNKGLDNVYQACLKLHLYLLPWQIK
jgi:hypothetical protein